MKPLSDTAVAHLKLTKTRPTDFMRTSFGDPQTALLKLAFQTSHGYLVLSIVTKYAEMQGISFVFVSFVTTDHAIAYQCITSVLLEDDLQVEIKARALRHDDAVQASISTPTPSQTTKQRLNDHQDSNTDYKIVDDRRLVSKKNLLVTLLGNHLQRLPQHGGLVQVCVGYVRLKGCLTAERLGTTPMYALNQGTDAARVANRTTSRRHKDYDQDVNRSMSSIK
ncbi:hypothetical protein MRX96_041407 [Rhipicephalus microplus]